MKFIPQPFDNKSDIIQARADGRYWALDPFQWPQMYDNLYAQSFAIPHQEAYADDTSMMYTWFRPTFSSDFMPISPSNLFGQLKTDIVSHLKCLYEKANMRVSKYKVARSHKEDHVVGWAHAMRAVHDHFQQAMAWCDIIIIIAEYQHQFLDIWAVLDYYKLLSLACDSSTLCIRLTPNGWVVSLKMSLSPRRCMLLEFPSGLSTMPDLSIPT
jgi:hypothetical protein